MNLNLFIKYFLFIKIMKVYVVKSLNGEEKYIDYTTLYPSQVLQSYIKKYQTYIKNNKKFNPIFNVIDLNDVWVEIIFESDDVDKITNFINEQPKNEIIENIKNRHENINIIKTPNEKNKNYHKEYYEKNKDKYMKENPEEYYNKNKKVLKEKSRRYYKKKTALERSKYSMPVEQFIFKQV